MELGNSSAVDTDHLIKDADINSFAADVLEASQSRPVIVDFWADWCGPCKQLMPMLEASVKAAGGAVALVKVDADKNQAICAQLQVQSLPTVLAFWQGQPVDGFQGAVPQSHLDAFIEKLKGLGGAEANPVDDMLKQADALLDAGENMHAANAYKQVLQFEQGNIHALIGMAEVSLHLDEKEQASQILAALSDDMLPDGEAGKALKDRLERVKLALELSENAVSNDEIASLKARIEADTKDFDARLALAKAEQANGDMAAAAEQLLFIMMYDREWADGEPHELLLKLFEVAGPADPFTLKYRRRLSSLIFS